MFPHRPAHDRCYFPRPSQGATMTRRPICAVVVAVRRAVAVDQGDTWRTFWHGAPYAAEQRLCWGWYIAWGQPPGADRDFIVMDRLARSPLPPWRKVSGG